MDNESFTDLLAGFDEPAAVDTEAPASAEVETAPLLDTPPSQTEAADPPAADPPAPVQPAWDSPDNPYFQQVQDLTRAQQAAQAQQRQWEEQQRQQAQWQQQQQQQARYQELDAKWREIAGGDLEAYDTIRASVAELSQPYMQQAQALYAEAEQAKRTATAIHIAATYGLAPEQADALNANVRHFMQMASPEQMLADVEYRRAVQQQQMGEVERLRQENAELRKFQEAQRQAQSRAVRGADATERGVGASSSPVSDTFDSFDDLFNRVIGAA